MKKKRSSDDKGLDMSDYGIDPGTVENPNDGAIAEFLYREWIGKAHKFESSIPTPTNGNEAPVKEPRWYHPGETLIGKILVGVGVLLLVIILAMFIFWKSVVNWWNGPAEEETKDGGGEKENEN